MKIATTLAALLCISFCIICIGQNPGLKCRLHSRGLRFAKDQLLKWLRPKLENLKIPNFSGSNYEIKNVEIDSFSLGSTSVETRPSNRFKASIDGASVKVSGSWKAWKKILFVTVRASGTASVSASDVDLSQEIRLGRTSSGKPKATIGDCKVSVRGFDVKLKGKNAFLSWVYNIVVNFFEDRIRKEVEKAICKQTVKVLKDKSGDITDDFNVNFPFILNSKINLGLTSSPSATTSYIYMAAKGRCFGNKNPQQSFPFSPPLTPSLTSTTQMVRISIGEYVMNTLLYTMWQDNRFTKSVGLRQVSQGLDKVFASPSIGRASSIFQTYRNRPKQVSIHAKDSPKANFYTNRVVITAVFLLDVNIILPTRTLRGVTITTNVRIEGKPYVSGGKLKASITDLSVVATDSDIEALSTSQINSLIQGFLPTQITPVLKGIVEAGFLIPEYFGYKATGLSLVVKSNAIEIGSDFKEA